LHHRSGSVLYRFSVLDADGGCVYHGCIYLEISMKTAKVFKSGNSQAVRIPKEFRLDGAEVEILRQGGALLLRPRKESWAALVNSLKMFSNDFMEDGRRQPPAQDRGGTFP
jgi:antitoxin VapB